MSTTTQQKIDWTRVNNDSNGNPRYVCHFNELLTSEEKYTPAKDGIEPQWIPIDKQYETALKKARKIGGRKFHNKQYGGGIVFQSYNIGDTEKQIKSLLNESK